MLKRALRLPLTPRRRLPLPLFSSPLHWQCRCESNASSTGTTTTPTSRPEEDGAVLVAAAQRRTEGQLAEVLKQVGLLRSQLLLLEQRLTTGELVHQQHDSQLQDCLRTMGDIKMETFSLHQIVQQLEVVVHQDRGVQGPGEAGSSTSTSGSSRSSGVTVRGKSGTPEGTASSSFGPEEVRRMIDAALAERENKNNNFTGGTAASGSTSSPVKEEEEGGRYADLQARVELLERSLVRQLFPLELAEEEGGEAKVEEISTTGTPERSSSTPGSAGDAEAATASVTEGAVQPKTSTPSTSDSTGSAAGRKDVSSRRVSALLQQLRVAGVMPFRDATGTIRVTGESVLLTGVPFTWGATHVRELCERRVTQGGGRKGVRSCLLASRSSIAGSSSGSTEASRCFEVKFHSAAEAVRAVVTLDGLVLPASPKSAPSSGSGSSSGERPGCLGVVPLVSPAVEEMMSELRRLRQSPSASPTSTSSASSEGNVDG